MFLKFEDCKMHWRSEVLKRDSEGWGGYCCMKSSLKEEKVCAAVAVVMERIRGLGGEIDGNWWLVECADKNSTDAFQI